jgi:hypothetical protein
MFKENGEMSKKIENPQKWRDSAAPSHSKELARQDGMRTSCQCPT